MEERKVWHSHHYEVKSGQIDSSGLRKIAQHELMEKLISTYGKTWHTWHMDHIDSYLWPYVSYLISRCISSLAEQQ
jgi:hypothetical protein